MRKRPWIVVAFVLCAVAWAGAAEPRWFDLGDSPGDEMLEAYFQAETAALTRNCLSDIGTLEQWRQRKEEYRRQLFEMLGLDPLPPRTPLAASVTGQADHDQFQVENIHFQSRPGLYVTGNLYVPKQREGKLPAILYVCGHGGVKVDGVSYGNKVSYQHHGGWFARNGYVCLIIDTLQLGEIEGIHHGTYREKMWWWNCRGYTSAGVEAWNCIRALDYLQSRPEVDPERIGVTGRSGGGAYSWWIAALDERIKAAVPVAGITSLQNHVVDGCVEGHCDCMFMLNTYRWDFPLVAALVAPRPLLISNTDKDRIFPLDGVVDVYNKTRRIYELYGQLDNIGLQICEGPHKDTQELRIPAFHWFNRFLNNDDPLIEMAAVKFFTPQQLKVFHELPEDQQNTTIQETFTETATAVVPVSAEQWEAQKRQWMTGLRQKVFRGWPDSQPASCGGLRVSERFSVVANQVRLAAYDFTSQQPGVRLQLLLACPDGVDRAELHDVALHALDEKDWAELMASLQPAFAQPLQLAADSVGKPQELDRLAGMLQTSRSAVAYIAPRGIGPTAWNPDERKQTQIRRRFMLLGQTRDGMRVWDVARAAAALRTVSGMQDVPLRMAGRGSMAGVVLYASLFTPDLAGLVLEQPPRSHRDGPVLLNVLRLLDMPQTVALAAQRVPVRIEQDDDSGWEYPQRIAKLLGWDAQQLQIRSLSEQTPPQP